jgi:hypothetical protein
MRCPDCNLMVSVETEEHEVDTIEVTDSGVYVNVRLVKNCAECGTELEEAYVEETIELDKVCEHDALEVEENGIESTDTGGGRYAKRFYGADVHYKVTCSECGFEHEDHLHVEEAASYFESLV